MKRPRGSVGSGTMTAAYAEEVVLNKVGWEHVERDVDKWGPGPLERIPRGRSKAPFSSA